MAINQQGDGGIDGCGLGTATSPVGFFGVTPVLQQTNPGNASTGAAGATSTVFLNTTFTGGTGSKAYTVGDVVLALKKIGIIAA